MKQFSVHDVLNPVAGIITGDGISNFKYKFLAQGDSWFHFGDLPPWDTTSIPYAIDINNACVVNCALSGRKLASMVDWTSNSEFVDMLYGKLAPNWDALLISGGGNDLIDMLDVLPRQSGGSRVAQPNRLLLEPSERNPMLKGVEKYISEPGWIYFSNRIKSEFLNLIHAMELGINKDIPVFINTYDYPTPRNAPAAINFGPWMYPPLSSTEFNIPRGDWIKLSKLLIDRLTNTLKEVVNANPLKKLILVDTREILIPASLRSKGVSGDWQNEIHPTSKGYKKLAQVWKKELFTVFPGIQ